MTKTDMIDRLVDVSGLQCREAKAVVELIFQIIKEAVARGEEVSILGFGVFDKRHYAERRGSHPQTGKPIQIAAAAIPGFRASPTFKAQVAESMAIA